MADVDRQRARQERGVGRARATGQDRIPPSLRERRPVLAALAVLLIVGGAATAGLLALRADDRVPVLVAARDIAAGEPLTEDALTTVPVAAESTLLVPADRADLLAGQFARLPISAGQLIDTTMLTASSMLTPGHVAVGAALSAGRMPASGLQPGDVVQLVNVDDPAGEVLVPDAVISSSRAVGADSTGGTSGAVVTVIVAEVDGARVATVAAAGDLAIVLVTRGEPRGQ